MKTLKKNIKKNLLKHFSQFNEPKIKKRQISTLTVLSKKLNNFLYNLATSRQYR